ncbi:MAG: protein kinase [Gemmatimonadaceae bacterium]|nr:protein kinase [Gemmatimonadaceae bacterium]
MSSVQDQLQRALGSAYRLERELGGGGMSHVYLAEEVALGRRVVIKVLPPDMAASVSVDRFRREIQLAAQLQHPGIVPLLTAGADGDLLWYVMPYVEGESLRTRLARGPLPIDEAVRLWRDLLEALEYAHGRGIVHRDIKPENIMLTGRRAVTLDFGVAKAVTASTGGGGMTMTGVGFAIGTPAYMAPEQAAGDGSVDARADLYAAGLVLYEMLAGRGPFEARSPAEMMAAHIATAPTDIRARRAGVSEALATTRMACLGKSPNERPAAASVVLADIDRGEARTRRADGTNPVNAVRARRSVLAGALAVAVVGAGAWWWRTRAADNERPSATSTEVLADSARLQVAILPVVSEPRDSIIAQSVVQAQINSLQLEPTILAQTPKRIRALAEDIGLVAATPDSLRQFYRDLGIHAYLQHTLVRSGDGLLLIAEGYSTRNDSALFRVEAPMNSSAEISSTSGSVVRDATAAIRRAVGKVSPPPVSGRLLGTSSEAAPLYLVSRRAWSDAEYAKSARLLREVLKADSNFAIAWSSLFSSNRNGQLSEHEASIASANAYRLRDRIPSRARRLFEECNHLRNAGLMDSALAVASRASKEFPDDGMIKSELGLAHTELRNLPLATEALRLNFDQTIASRMSTNVGPANYVAALLREGRVEEARKALRRTVAVLGESDGQTLVTRELFAAAELDPDSLLAVGSARLRRAGGDRDPLPGYAALAGGYLLAGRLDSALTVEALRRTAAQAGNQQLQRIVSLAPDVYWRASLRPAATNAAGDFTAALRTARWDTLPALDRAYGAVIQAYIATGDIAAARQSLAEWERTVPKVWVAAQRPLIDAAAGEIALAAGDGKTALKAFRAADVGRCISCGEVRIARAFDRLEQPDSVIAWYERALSKPTTRLREADLLEYPRAYRRLGELYEAKGDTKRAIQRYSDFVELWKNADPALQPLVKDVRDRIARLQRKSG